MQRRDAAWPVVLLGLAIPFDPVGQLDIAVARPHDRAEGAQVPLPDVHEGRVGVPEKIDQGHGQPEQELSVELSFDLAYSRADGLEQVQE